MRIFLSYASEQYSIAEEMFLALRNGGHQVFFRSRQNDQLNSQPVS